MSFSTLFFWCCSDREENISNTLMMEMMSCNDFIYEESSDNFRMAPTTAKPQVILKTSTKAEGRIYPTETTTTTTTMRGRKRETRQHHKNNYYKHSMLLQCTESQTSIKHFVCIFVSVTCLMCRRCLRTSAPKTEIESFLHHWRNIKSNYGCRPVLL